MPLSIIKRKASRAGVWPKLLRTSALEFVIPEIYNQLLIKKRTCFARLSSNHSFLCYVPKPGPHSRLSCQSRDDGPVHLARLTAPLASQSPGCPARGGHQRRRRCLTLTRATRSLRMCETASNGLASLVDLASFVVVLILSWACIIFI